MISLDEDLRDALRKNGARPVVRVQFDNAELWVQTIAVSAWSTAAGGGQTITVGAYSIVEGTDFDAETSNVVTAANIESALASEISGEDIDWYIHREDGTDRIFIISYDTPQTISVGPVGIDLVDTATMYVSFSNGYLQGSVSESVIEFKTSGTRVDPISRDVSVGDADLLLTDDHVARKLFTHFNMRNARVQVYLGEEDSAAEDLLFTYRVADFRYEDGGIRVTLREPGNLLAEIDIDGRCASRHPLSAIKEFNLKAGLQDGDAFDFDSLSLANISQNLRGYCVGRADEWHVSYDYIDTGVSFGNRIIYTHSEGGKLGPALDFIREVVSAFGGTIRTKTSGILEFVEYDASASADWIFSSEDFADFQQLSSTENVITRVVFNAGRVAFEQSDDRAVRLSAASDKLTYSTYSFDSPYVNPVGALNRTGTAPFGSGITWTGSYGMTNADWIIARTAASGMCGTHQVPLTDDMENGPFETQIELHSDQVSTNGLEEGVIFCRVDHYEFPGLPGEVTTRISNTSTIDNAAFDQYRALSAYEFIAFTPNLLSTSNGTDSFAYNAVEGDVRTQPTCFRGGVTHYTIATSYTNAALGFSSGRGGFGTTAFSGTLTSGEIEITDVTLAYKRAKEILDRFAFGAPVIEFTLPLHFAGIQIGDFFTITNWDRFIHFKHNNTNGIVFEVTAVTHDLVSDTPGVRVEGTYVRSDNMLEVFPDETNVTPEVAPLPTYDTVTTSGADDVTTSGGDTVVIEV